MTKLAVLTEADGHGNMRVAVNPAHVVAIHERLGVGFTIVRLAGGYCVDVKGSFDHVCSILNERMT